MVELQNMYVEGQDKTFSRYMVANVIELHGRPIYRVKMVSILG